MVTTLLITIFIAGYIAIAFEHAIKLNKAASALITGVLCWTIYILQSNSVDAVGEELLHHIGGISSILFFLLGAMTIVELIDSHDGFDVITLKINTTSKSKLLLIITVISFFLLALLDNLTMAIVMTSLSSKILSEKDDKLWFCRYDCYCCQCRWCMVAFGRCNYNYVTDWWTNNCAQHYETTYTANYSCLFISGFNICSPF